MGGASTQGLIRLKQNNEEGSGWQDPMVDTRTLVAEGEDYGIFAVQMVSVESTRGGPVLDTVRVHVGFHATSEGSGSEHEGHHTVHNSWLANTSGLMEGQFCARSPPPEMMLSAGPEDRSALTARWLMGRVAVATPLRGEQPAAMPAEA
jgi:hypothetical protein